MPFRNKAGPLELGRLPERKQHRCRRGRMDSSLNAGPTEFCICPSCGIRISHQTGIPCSSVNCPKCGIRMVRL